MSTLMVRKRDSSKPERNSQRPSLYAILVLQHQFVVKILMENKGENWWTECVSDKIRKSADSRKAEEDKIKWHTHRGTSMINYVDFADLANIMEQNYDLFEVHIVSLEWAKQIFTTLEKSRNVIMHSGELGERDIERIGINIRDWISQVGA